MKQTNSSKTLLQRQTTTWLISQSRFKRKDDLWINSNTINLHSL